MLRHSGISAYVYAELNVGKSAVAARTTKPTHTHLIFSLCIAYAFGDHTSKLVLL